MAQISVSVVSKSLTPINVHVFDIFDQKKVVEVEGSPFWLENLLQVSPRFPVNADRSGTGLIAVETNHQHMRVNYPVTDGEVVPVS